MSDARDRSRVPAGIGLRGGQFAAGGQARAEIDLSATAAAPLGPPSVCTHCALAVVADGDGCDSATGAHETVDETAARLADRYRDALDEDDLGEMVHDLAAQVAAQQANDGVIDAEDAYELAGDHAAGINNNGLGAQIEYFIDQLGAEGAASELERIAGEPHTYQV